MKCEGDIELLLCKIILRVGYLHKKDWFEHGVEIVEQVDGQILELFYDWKMPNLSRYFVETIRKRKSFRVG